MTATQKLASLSLLLTCSTAPALAQVPRDSAVARALAYIEAAASAHREAEGTPGIVVTVVDRLGVLGVRAVGVADLAAHTALSGEGRFLAGSISKAFTAVALLQLQEEGLVDIHRPLTDYLPWFRMRSGGSAITVEQLLTHTAGLPRDRGDLPSSPYTALALREREPGAPPGERFAYSNIGYQLLSLLIEEVEGRPFTECIRRRVIEPLGLRATVPEVTPGQQIGAVTGYQYLWDDRPPASGDPLMPVTWGEYSAGDANLVTTGPDLAVFLQTLLNQGQGPQGRLLQPASFGRMVSRLVRAPELGPDMFYGYGLALGSLDGDPVLWHSGGMPGYRTMMIGDMDEGIGVVILMNGPGNPRRLAEYSLRVLIEMRRRHEPPPVLLAAPPDVVPDAGSYAGIFTDSAGATIALEADGNRLFLRDGERRIALERAGSAEFVVKDAAWRLFPLEVVRDRGHATEVLHGGRWFTSEYYRGPKSFAVPDAWRPFVGHYRSQVAYFSNYRVVLRKGELLLVSPEGATEPLVKRGHGFGVGRADHPIELVQFADIVSGRALRMNLSGTDYYRATTP